MSEGDFLFHGVAFNPATVEVREFTFEDLDRELNDERVVFSWIDIQSSDISRLNDVLRRWEIEPVQRAGGAAADRGAPRLPGVLSL